MGVQETTRQKEKRRTEVRQPRIKVICSRELADDYVVGVVFIYECKTWDIFIDYGVFTRFGFYLERTDGAMRSTMQPTKFLIFKTQLCGGYSH